MEGPSRLHTWKRKIDYYVRQSEPYSILFAVVAFVLSLMAYWEEQIDREQDWTNRARQAFHDGIGHIDTLKTLLRDDPRTSEIKGVCEGGQIELTRFEAPRAFLPHAPLRNACLWDANLKNAIFAYADLNGANLKFADLTNVDFTDADLSRACIERADLTEADFQDAILVGADLTRANLDKTKFENANLSAAKLTNAVNIDSALFLDSARFCRTIMPNYSICDRDCDADFNSRSCSWFTDAEASSASKTKNPDAGKPPEFAPVCPPSRGRQQP